MSSTRHFATTLAAPDVEVVTVHEILTGEYVTMVHGGRLDGFSTATSGILDPQLQHDAAVSMVQSAAHEEVSRVKLIERMKSWDYGARGKPRRLWRHRRF